MELHGPFDDDRYDPRSALMEWVPPATYPPQVAGGSTFPPSAVRQRAPGIHTAAPSTTLTIRTGAFENGPASSAR